MSCNPEIHEELKNMDEITCPFCNQEIGEHTIKKGTCCSEQNVENHDNMNVCIKCGSVYGYENAHEFVDFYDNIYKIQRKSIYHREYHIKNKITDLCCKNKYQISPNDEQKVIKVFEEIDKILPQINQDRKRMIDINYILKQIFMMLNLPIEKAIKYPKSKETLDKYEKYWNDIQSLIGDKIKSIINK